MMDTLFLLLLWTGQLDPSSCWGTSTTKTQGFVDRRQRRITTISGGGGSISPLFNEAPHLTRSDHNDESGSLMDPHKKSSALHVASIEDADLYAQTGGINPFSHVVLTVKAVAMSMIKAWHKHLPEPFRFFISGRVGDVFFYFLERRLSFLLSTLLASSSGPTSSVFMAFLSSSQDTLSFLAGYCLHVIPQHLLHALLVYGLDTINTRRKYTDTLVAMYQAMITSALGAAALNTLLLQTLPISKTAVFVLTLGLFSTINYFWIGWMYQRKIRYAAPATIVVPLPESADGSRTTPSIVTPAAV